MPWNLDDVEKHKKGLTDKKKRQWLDTANSALQRCLDRGGNEAECAASAIRQANGVTGNMEVYFQISNNYRVQERQHQGRKHLVVPVVMMVEGVHAGSHGALLHRIEEMGRYPASWNGIPVVVDHPSEDGQNISANSPEIIDSRVVGRVYNTHVSGAKLKAEVWLDEEKLRQVCPVILTEIREYEPIEVSIGVFTDDEIVTGDWNGEAYEAIARNHRPDHLALLPGGAGACSLADGCGIRSNKNNNAMDVNEQVSAMEKKRKELGMSVAEFYAVPRDPPSESKLPIFDESHVRNAMARFNQTQGLSSEERATAKRKIISRAHHFGIDTSGFEGTNEHHDVQAMKSLKEDGLAVVEIINHTTGGIMERVDACRRKIDSMDTSDMVNFLLEVYDGELIYEVRQRIGGSKIYKQGYKFESGIVEFTCNPVEVHKKVEYISVNSTNFKKGGQQMSNEGCAPCIKEKVDKLIANSKGNYTEDDREWLQTLDEKKLDKLAKPIEVEKEVVKEVNALSDEDKAALEAYKKQLKEKRERLIKAIQNNSDKETWTDAVLSAMSDDNLERLFKSVRRDDVTDYSLVGDPAFKTGEHSGAGEILYPAGVKIETKK